MTLSWWDMDYGYSEDFVDLLYMQNASSWTWGAKMMVMTTTIPLFVVIILLTILFGLDLFIRAAIFCILWSFLCFSYIFMFFCTSTSSSSSSSSSSYAFGFWLWFIFAYLTCLWCRCYIKLYDSPSKSKTADDDEMSGLLPSQKKKLRQKQRKAEARAKKVCLTCALVL